MQLKIFFADCIRKLLDQSDIFQEARAWLKKNDRALDACLL
jgi:hypothetical protein